MSEQDKSVQQIEADIAASRTRLAGTIDELTTRAQPKEIARRQADSAKSSFMAATHTPEGDLRIERIGAAAGALVALVAAVVVLRRRRG